MDKSATWALFFFEQFEPSCYFTVKQRTSLRGAKRRLVGAVVVAKVMAGLLAPRTIHRLDGGVHIDAGDVGQAAAVEVGLHDSLVQLVGRSGHPRRRSSTLGFQPSVSLRLPPRTAGCWR
jgi:hypothetical protein